MSTIIKLHSKHGYAKYSWNADSRHLYRSDLGLFEDWRQIGKANSLAGAIEVAKVEFGGHVRKVDVDEK